jgi:hypothetical protein
MKSLIKCYASSCSEHSAIIQATGKALTKFVDMTRIKLPNAAATSRPVNTV